MSIEKEIYKDPAEPVEVRVEDLLSRMNLDEKVAQLRAGWPMCYGFKKCGGKVEILDGAKEALTGTAIGQLIALLRAGPWTGIDLERGLSRIQGAELVNEIQRHVKHNTRLGIPVLIGDDGNHGQLGIGATAFPALCGIGCSWNRDLLEKMSRAMAREIRAQGQTIVYTPDLDVIRDPRYGRCEENFGEDPYLVGQMGMAMVRGLQGDDLSSDSSVVALLRAYPGMGDAEGGHDFTRIGLGRREMQEVVLRPWRDAVRQGALGVMIERAEYDGEAAPGSHYYMTELLRDKWDFTGITLGDAGAVKYLQRVRLAKTKTEAAAMALKAGLDQNLNDFMMPGIGSDDSYAEGLPDALERGLITMEDIDRSVRRVLRLKFMLGLFERPYVDPEKAHKIARCDEHRQIALDMAKQSIVLLKNTNSLLPLGGSIGSVALVGPGADSTWNQLGDQAITHRREDVVTILDGMKAGVEREGIVLHHARGCGIRDLSREGFADAVAAAENSDAIVAVVGDSCRIRYPHEGEIFGERSAEADCGENVARASLELSGVQGELLRELKQTGKPLIVVLIHGRALAINWIAENADAVVDAWYPGEQGGTAVADVLFGDYNPGGKLAVSVPKHVGQLPVYYYHRHQNGRYVEFDSDPLYPFGYGLSYTSFSYANLRIEPQVISKTGTCVVRADISNTGSREGDEVAQLYIQDEHSSTVRPHMELKGFSRVHIEAGESKTVDFEVGWEELCFCGPDYEWILEPGTFKIMVGGSSTDLPLTGTLEVEE